MIQQHRPTPARRRDRKAWFVPAAAAAAVLAAGLTAALVAPATASGSSGQTGAAAAAASLKAPAKFTAGSGRDANSLSWAASTGARKYEVHRAPAAGGAYSRIGTVTSTRFTDDKAVPDVAYRYKVRARGTASQVSPYSTVARATRDTLAPLPPQDLTARAGEGPGTPLVWRSGGTDAVSYTVYRTTSPNSPSTKVGTSGTTSFRDLGPLEEDQLYIYYVTGTDAAGNESEASQWETVR
ncbi:fibronectin type III domain-containing protein [Streptomyces sp. NPDC017941]|uniref:fibronectin type III domain-containing protein n=1 Tax=Streptomyces sp. NPDC017941 TaxID=3365018 RepID=UPI00378BEB1C